MILGIAFLLMVSLVLGAAISALGKWWGGCFGGWETLLQVVNLRRRLRPDDRRLRDDLQADAARAGAAGTTSGSARVVTALLFTIGKFLIGLYIGKSGVASGFGAAGSLIVVFVWVYYSAQIFLLGAEFTWVYAKTLGSLRSEEGVAEVAQKAARTDEVPSAQRGPEARRRRRARRRARAGRRARGAARRRSATSAPASPSSSPCAISFPACCAGSEDRDLQHQRRQAAPAAAARVAGRGRARRRLPAGAEGGRRRVPARRASRRPATARSGAASGPGTASPSWPAAPSRSRRGARLPGDAGRHARPLHRGGGRRRARRLPLPAQRQPAAGPEVRLQAGLVRAADRPRRGAARRAGHPVVLAGDYNVVPTDADIYATRSWRDERAAAAGAARRLPAPARAGLDRRDPRRCIPTSAIYTFWDYLRNALAARRRPAHRPPAAQPERSRRGSSRAGVDRDVRGRENASDHAPAWIELE